VKNPTGAPGRTQARYPGLRSRDCSTGKRKMLAEDRGKRSVDGRCLYYGGLNIWATDCAARNKAQTFKVAGAEIRVFGTRPDSEEFRNDLISQSKMPL